MLCTSGFVDDVMFSYHGTNERTGMALSGSPCGGAAAAHWLAGFAGRLAGLADAPFAVCYMLVLTWGEVCYLGL